MTTRCTKAKTLTTMKDDGEEDPFYKDAEEQELDVHKRGNNYKIRCNTISKESIMILYYYVLSDLINAYQISISGEH